MIEQNYAGYLLAAHPKRGEVSLRKSTMLIIDHDASGAIGLQVNKPFISNVTLSSVMQNIGLVSTNDQPLFNGGPESSNRIHIVHSLDWFSPTTNKLNDHIGISSDISVLTAISKDEGPNYFRAIAGFTRWLPGHLEGEILGESPWTIQHCWSYIPANADTLFLYTEIDQWHRVITDASRHQIANWF